MSKYRVVVGWKYQLIEDYTIQTNIKDRNLGSKFLYLNSNGELLIQRFYAWDGPSGPTLDTADFMEGSLVHDALYQLMRLGLLPQSYRKYADELLRDICRMNGMCRFRNWYTYWAVRLFAGKAARVGTEVEVKIREL
jgi:hypothetical protein